MKQERFISVTTTANILRLSVKNHNATCNVNKIEVSKTFFFPTNHHLYRNQVDPFNENFHITQNDNVYFVSFINIKSESRMLENETEMS